MAYIGNSPGVASQRVVTTFTATASQTTFTPSSGYTVGYLDVYHNGVKLINGDDYTASNGTTFVLASGAASGDVIEAVAYLPRGLSDGYTRAEADTRYVNASGDTMTGALSISKDAAAVQTLNRTTSDGDIQVFKKDGTTVGSIGAFSGLLMIGNSGNTGLLFDSGEIYPVDAQTGSVQNGTKDLGASGARFKNLYLSGGVYLGGTGAANYLDDYEEGTWTATLTNANSVTTTTQSYNKYVKIGSWVYVQGYIDFSGSDSSSSSIRVSGLPFACASSVTGSCIDRYAAGVTMMPYAGSSQTYLVFYQAGVASSQTWNGISYNEVGQLMAHFAIAYQTTT
jgi:hypothetical protein